MSRYRLWVSRTGVETAAFLVLFTQGQSPIANLFCCLLHSGRFGESDPLLFPASSIFQLPCLVRLPIALIPRQRSAYFLITGSCNSIFHSVSDSGIAADRIPQIPVYAVSHPPTRCYFTTHLRPGASTSTDIDIYLHIFTHILTFPFIYIPHDWRAPHTFPPSARGSRYITPPGALVPPALLQRSQVLSHSHYQTTH